jgi:hypothetical protein
VVVELGLGLGSVLLAAGWLSGQLTVWQAEGQALILATAGQGDPSAWFQAGWVQVQSALDSMMAGFSGASSGLSLALPVTAWAAILTGMIMLGVLANGVILRRLARANPRAA